MRQSGDGDDDGNGDALAAALAPLSYRMALIKTHGGKRHHTLSVLYDANGIMFQALPPDTASALAAVFQQEPNLYRVTPSWRRGQWPRAERTRQRCSASRLTSTRSPACQRVW